MSFFTSLSNRLIYTYDAEKLWIESWGPNALRVRATEGPSIPEENWALLPVEPVKVQITIDESGATITNGQIKAKISNAGKIIFYNHKNEVLLEEFVRNNKDLNAEYCSSLGIDAREHLGILGGDYEITARFESDAKEKIFGMGQYQQANLNLKGCELELAQRNSQASVPFAVSSLGYGFLWNNPAIGNVMFGNNRTTWKAKSTKLLDYLIIAGDTPAEIEEAYAKVTGTVPMMPDYAMGFWQCKLRYQTQEELLEVAREYKRRNLPISVIVIDYFHWPKQGDWRFDPTYWPDPDAMIAELEEMGIELMISVWPTVDNESENYQEMLEKGYLIRTDRGLRFAMAFHGNIIHFDPTNPEARDYVWNKIKKSYYDKGIRIFWLDEAEPEYTVHDFDIYRYHLGSNLQVGNSYPMMYAKTFFDGMKSEGQENIINLIRCAWAGSQRYGSLVWSGDTYSSFSNLRNQISAGLNMGLAGIPWWTHDIGGFHGGNPESEDFRELLIRWFQFGAFSPVMRLHGDRVPKQPQLGNSGGSTCLSGAPNEVWSFGETAYEICKKYLFIREKMKPYIKELMQEASDKGTPVMRTLFYQYPEDEMAWNIEDQYMFGPDVLVAPIYEKGARERKVYLPKGETWRNIWNNQIIEGGATVTVAAALDQIPVFVRKDAEIAIL